MITEFLISNASIIISILIILVAMIGLVLSKKWAELRAEAYKLVIQLQALGETKEGKEKFEMGLDRLYSLIPIGFRSFITKDSIAKLLQKCYEELKDYLDDGILNKSNKK